MGVKCQILISKPNEGVHRAGQLVTGNIRYIVNEPTQFQHVTLSFLGKGKCVWRTGTTKNRKTHRGKEDYVITHVNIWNKKPQDTVTLEGKYEHPFEFFLPENIPRSYKDEIGCISYKIELKFEKPSFFSFNKVFTAEIPVYNYLNPTTEGPLIYALHKELFAPFAPKTPTVNIKAEIDKTCLTPGEKAHISYMITNDTDVEIISVRTELYSYTTYTSNQGRTKCLEAKIDSCEARTSSIPRRKVSRYICLVPTRSELYSLTNSKVISIEYKIRVTVRFPMPHLNATMIMPVLIGEVKRRTEPTDEMLEGNVKDGERSARYGERSARNGERSVKDEERNVKDEEQSMKNGEPPPSHWEVMRERKKENKSDYESD